LQEEAPTAVKLQRGEGYAYFDSRWLQTVINHRFEGQCTGMTNTQQWVPFGPGWR